MVKENPDGTFTFKNGVTAKLVNGEYKLINKKVSPQTGGKVSLPSEYFGNMTKFYQDIPTNNDVVNPNAELPSGDVAREAIPTTQFGGNSYGNKLDYIYDIDTHESVSLFSNRGKELLKKYIRMSKKPNGTYY